MESPLLQGEGRAAVHLDDMRQSTGAQERVAGSSEMSGEQVSELQMQLKQSQRDVKRLEAAATDAAADEAPAEDAAPPAPAADDAPEASADEA